VKSRRSKTGMSGIGPCGGGTSPWETTTDDTSDESHCHKTIINTYLNFSIVVSNVPTHTMATRTPTLRYFARATSERLVTGLSRRQFTACATRSTDGVFRALTENRVRTPWVEALRKQKEDGTDPTKASGKPETPSDRDLSPRSMSDSYHSVV
jgi:hypothetical protein